MPKEEKEFPNLLPQKLEEIIDKTLGSLKSSDWKIKYKTKENDKIIWVVSVPSKYLFSFRLYIIILLEYGVHFTNV